jgi:D-alanyl-D-alanine carboxypeptidase (penicillin-binding protein 5/6)
MSLKRWLSLILLFMTIAGCPVLAETKQPEAVTANDLLSQSAILMDADTGQILFEKNMHEKLSPASITKIMTALLALEKGDLSDSITMSHDAVFSVPRGASHIALDEGEVLTLKEAMYAMMLVSANDAANGIAEYISGSIKDFADLMNQRALELGAKNTNFVNPSGLTVEGHYTTAYDMALITLQAMQHQDFNTIWGTSRYEMAPTNKQPEVRFFNNQNRMLISSKYQYEDVIGGKLGWTTEAQNTMVVAAKRNDRTLLCVLFKSQDPQAKYQDAKLLFDYGFDQFRKISLEELSISSDYSFLLHNSIATNQILVAYDLPLKQEDGSLQQKLHLSLPEDLSHLMYPEIGSSTLIFQAAPEVSSKPWQQTLLEGSLVFLKILAGLLLLLFILACIFRTRRRLRRRRRQRQRQLQGNRSNMLN